MQRPTQSVVPTTVAAQEITPSAVLVDAAHKVPVAVLVGAAQRATLFAAPPTAVPVVHIAALGAAVYFVSAD